MKILVTGGAGFIGSHTVDRLLASGHAVRVLDNLTEPVHRGGAPEYLNADAELVVGDVRRREDWLRALEGVEAVYHLAAYQDYLPDFSKFFGVNAAGTALLYELAVEKRLPLHKVIVASSQAVYGEGRHRCAKGHVTHPPMRSEDQLRRGGFEIRCPDCGQETEWQPTDEETVNPQNQYALSKHSEEQIALHLGRRYGIPSVALRYSIVQGARQSFHNAYSGACRVFCTSLHLGRSAPIYEDGLQVRDFVDIDDVVDANLLVLERDEADGRVFNVGGGRAYSVAEFAGIAAREFGREADTQPSGLYRFGDTRHVVSDTSRLRALGWKPRRSARDSVAAYAAWLRRQKDVEDALGAADRTLRERGVLREVERATRLGPPA